MTWHLLKAKERKWHAIEEKRRRRKRRPIHLPHVSENIVNMMKISADVKMKREEKENMKTCGVCRKICDVASMLARETISLVSSSPQKKEENIYWRKAEGKWKTYIRENHLYQWKAYMKRRKRRRRKKRKEENKAWKENHIRKILSLSLHVSYIEEEQKKAAAYRRK